MKFIVEFRLKPGSRNKAVDAFDLRGPNRNPGVSLHAAWVGTNSDVVFALGESEDESLVRQACSSWAEVDDFIIHPVIEIEQF
jgi:hypothetical protein